MIKRFSLLFLLLFAVTLVVNAQQTPPPPPLYAGEYWTSLYSMSYDYQTNGSIRYYVQDPTTPGNLCAILMSQKDSNDAVGVNRYVYFSYSSDGGRTWTESVVFNGSANGFPSMDVNNGIPIVALHTGSSTGSFVYKDALWGGFAFSTVGTLPLTPVAIIWPHVSSTTNGNIVIVAAPNPGFQAHYNFYNGTAWASNNIELSNTGGPSGNFSNEAGPGGSVSIFGMDYNGDGSNKWWLSNNNGANFTLQTSNTIPPYILDSGDTLFAYIDGGRQANYIGSNVGVVFSVYASNSEGLPSPPNTNWYKKSRIYFWSQATGAVEVASKTTIPSLTDTITHALTAPVCQPTLGKVGNTLYCTFTAFLYGDKQTVNDGSQVNCGEIFLSYSTNNGANWSTPVNLTNTPGKEEKHSSVIRSGSFSDSAVVFYLRDMKAGGWVNVSAWGKAPVYGIVKKIGSGTMPIGIRQEIQTVREYKLFQNYPNPFNPTTTISYYIPKSGNVTVKVFNVLGSEVATVVNGFQNSGAKEVVFDGSQLASGIYYYTIEAGSFRDTKKMILVK